MKRIGAVLLALMLLMTAGTAFAADTPGEAAEAAAAPEWADVKLNSRGFIDEGEYIFADDENGHWMYVSPSLRIEIVRTLETPEKKKKSDKMQQFYCYTADIRSHARCVQAKDIVRVPFHAEFLHGKRYEHAAVFPSLPGLRLMHGVGIR